jgi:uncharacterized membrane protein YqjE
MTTPPDKTPLGDSIGDIIDRTTKIVHEEIELAKAEMASAAQDLLRGSVAGIVGGVFAFFGLFILLIGLSFLIADAVGTWYPWLGFFIVAFLLFAFGGLLAFVALKKIKKGSQLTPTQAIDEAKQTRDALQKEADTPIDSVAVEEPTPGDVPAAAVKPLADLKAKEAAAADPAVVEAKHDLEDARNDADLLELDAKEMKRRAKQEAKEAKEAAKAAKVAEQEAAKAEAIAAKAAEKAQKEGAKAKAKAEKEAAKKGKKGGGEAEAPAAPQAPAPPVSKAPAPPQPPTAPPAPPTSPSPQAPPTPPQAPPAPPHDTSKPYDPKRDN